MRRLPGRCLILQGRGREPRPGARAHASAHQCHPAPQRHPQADRHGPPARRSELPAELSRGDRRADSPDVTPVRINFGSIHGERATARRIFMTLAQMLKLINSAEPVRFLIAECETGLHAADRPLLRQALRRRRPDRPLAALRDREGARARRHAARGGAGLARLSGLSAGPAAACASRRGFPMPAAIWASSRPRWRSSGFASRLSAC